MIRTHRIFPIIPPCSDLEERQACCTTESRAADWQLKFSHSTAPSNHVRPWLLCPVQDIRSGLSFNRLRNVQALIKKTFEDTVGIPSALNLGPESPYGQQWPEWSGILSSETSGRWQLPWLSSDSLRNLRRKELRLRESWGPEQEPASRVQYKCMARDTLRWRDLPLFQFQMGLVSWAWRCKHGIPDPTWFWSESN